MRKKIGRLHLITDSIGQHRYSHAELARMAIEGGADTIQYRSKSNDIRRMIEEASAVAAICRAANVLFLVNDRVDIALAVDADGVHLGREDMPIPMARRLLGANRIIGGTIRSVAHLIEATEESADYVGLGPIYHTGSKALSVAPLGLRVIREVAALSTIPVIAIAGISSANVREVIGAGASGVAVIGAICHAEDVAAAARAISSRLDTEG